MKQPSWKVTESDDGRYRVMIEGEAEPFWVERPVGFSRKDVMIEITAIVLNRMVRKELEEATASIAHADKLLSEKADAAAGSPPAIAEALISAFTPKRFAEAQIGDMQEIFQANVQRYGVQRAKRLYRYEVARSIGPILFHWLKRIGFIAVLVDYSRKKMGL